MTTADVGVAAGDARREPLRLPLRGLAEATTLLWVYVVYAGLRNLVTGSAAAAAFHADQLLHVERFLGIGIGQTVRDATQHLQWVTSFGSLVYATHAVVPVVVLCVLHRRLPDRYRRWRNTFVIGLALGLIGFWLYPVMPPWILANSYHFVNTSRRLSIGHTPLPGAVVPDPDRFDVFGFSNPYASMPSLHVAWALFASIAAWPLLRSRLLKATAVLYPVLMIGAVTVTWNHWILDSIGGGVAVLVAYAFSGLVARIGEGTRTRNQENDQLRLAGDPVEEQQVPSPSPHVARPESPRGGARASLDVGDPGPHANW